MMVFTGVLEASLFHATTVGGLWLIPVTIPYTQYFAEIRVKSPTGTLWMDPSQYVGVDSQTYVCATNSTSASIGDNTGALTGWTYMIIVVAK